MASDEQILLPCASRTSFASLSASPAQKRWNVTLPVNYRDNLHRAFLGSVDDEVVADRPEKNRKVGKVFPLMPHTGIPCESFKRIEEPCALAVRRMNALFGDVVPSIIQVLFRVAAKNVTAQACRFRRSCDFRWRRVRTSAGSTLSPRSKEAKRRPSSWLNSAS